MFIDDFTSEVMIGPNAAVLTLYCTGARPATAKTYMAMIKILIDV